MGLIDAIFGGGGNSGARRDSCALGLFGFPCFSSSSSSVSSSSTSNASTFFLHLLLLHLFWILTSSNNYSVMGGGSTECMKRKYYEITVSYFGGLTINRTVKCDMYFQWTVADYCCYDKYDRFERNPFCCYSETYKLVLAVGFICLVLLASSFSIFCCWLYNLPHHLLYLLTCGKFRLNEWMVRNKNGPYVDPTFYSGEPFWARGAEMQPYPLRPMPPKIFYPAPPPKLKYRWDMANGEIPLFVIASRQFTRNPYSARPQDRNTPAIGNGPTYPSTHGSGGGLFCSSESRRNSLSSNQNASGVITSNTRENVSSAQSGQQLTQQQRQAGSAQNGAPRRGSSALYPPRQQPPAKEPPPFQCNIDEVEAAQELFEALKMLEDRGDKTVQEWNAMIDDTGRTYSPAEEDRRNGSSGGSNHLNSSGGVSGSNGIFTLSDGTIGPSSSGGSNGAPFGGRVRPNTTGSGGSLDQYGNYVSLTNHTAALTKPNTDILNQQLSTLGLPIYSMPGVHTAGVVSTVQNYHVVSSNLGNPMETILEDDSLDEEIIPESSTSRPVQNGKSDKFEEVEEEEEANDSCPTASSYSSSVSNLKDKRKKPPTPIPAQTNRRPVLKRRATTITSSTVESPVRSRSISRVGSALDHVVGPTPTTRADVPFMPTLPGSMVPEGPLDAMFVDTVVRRNSVI